MRSVGPARCPQPRSMNTKETSRQLLTFFSSPPGFGCHGTFLGSTEGAHSEHIDRNSGDVKALKETLLCKRPHLHALGVEIGDLAAASTNQVIVLTFVRFDAHG